MECSEPSRRWWVGKLLTQRSIYGQGELVLVGDCGSCTEAIRNAFYGRTATRPDGAGGDPELREVPEDELAMMRVMWS